MSKLEEIEVKIRSQFVPVLGDKFFCKSSNLILALGMDPSFGPGSRVGIFCRRECFLCISIFSSLPSTSMLRHMNMYDCSRHNNLNLPLVLGERQMLFIPDVFVQFFFKATIDVVRAFDNQWVWKFIDLCDEFWMSI